MKKSILVAALIAFTVVAFMNCKKDCHYSERCDLVPDSGVCLAAFPKYYYDKDEKKCKQFIWGGCGGVVPFETLEECKNGCGCDK
ncbi:MAG: BPTI/Kunitz domain-containing protein [Chitinophagaceae bacterium]